MAPLTVVSKDLTSSLTT